MILANFPIDQHFETAPHQWYCLDEFHRFLIIKAIIWRMPLIEIVILLTQQSSTDEHHSFGF